MMRFRVRPAAEDAGDAMQRLAAADAYEGTGYATAAEECRGAALFEVEIEGEVCGAFAVRIVKHAAGDELNCIAAAGRGPADLTAIIDYALTDLARATGAAVVTMTTARRGLGRKVAKLGWRPAATLWAKEVHHAPIQ